MAYEGYDCLKVRVERGVAFVTIDHPPINLFDLPLMQEIDRIGRELEADGAVRVVVFDSADPEFFIAHADVGLIQRLPTEPPPKPTSLGLFHAMVDRFRTMPKATIAKIEGRARGGGSEFILSLDLRFGALGRAILAQPEVALGIIPGGSGTQRLPRLIGRSRALEVILGCEDIPADLAERYGYLNRALPPGELGPFVERLAYRIASFPAEAIALAKRAVNAAELPTVEGLLEEADCFNHSLPTPAARRRMARFLELGGQTRETELALGGLVERLREQPLGSRPPVARVREDEMLRLLEASGIPLVAVQYPVRSVEPLRRLLGARRDVWIVDNQAVFKEALRQAPYAEYFVDTFGGDFGHTTPRGAHLPTENVAQSILAGLFRQ